MYTKVFLNALPMLSSRLVQMLLGIIGRISPGSNVQFVLLEDR